MAHIPIQLLRLDKRAEMGFEIRHHLNGVDEEGLEARHHLNNIGEESIEEFYAHRNDNYFFTLTERGYGSMNVDFNMWKFNERDICFVAPGQVHYDARADKCDYWYISAATSLIPKDYLEIFENAAPFQKPQNLNAGEFEQCQTILHLLAKHFNSDPQAVYYRQLIQELLQTFLCMVARQYVQNNVTDDDIVSRPQQITRDFKRLLEENMKMEKSPSYYAAILNISESYLNEAVKKTTGFTVGYWIRYSILLEAKRLLFYTEMSVKEIAYSLGYDNYTYFSKLFRQTTGITPLTFRNQYLK